METIVCLAFFLNAMNIIGQTALFGHFRRLLATLHFVGRSCGGDGPKSTRIVPHALPFFSAPFSRMAALCSSSINAQETNQ